MLVLLLFSSNFVDSTIMMSLLRKALLGRPRKLITNIYVKS